MRTKKIKSYRPAISKLRNELKTILDEWDDLEVEDIHTRISKAVSAAIKDKGVTVKTSVRKRLSKGPRLGEFMEAMVGDTELTERAEYFESLTNPYTDEIDDDDMAEAFEVMEEIVAGLDEILGERNAAPD